MRNPSYYRLGWCALICALAATAWAAETSKVETPEQIREKCDARVDALAGKSGLKVLVIRVEGEIDIRQAAYVGRAVRDAGSFKPELVLVELNTPGGEITYMEEIGKAIKSLEPIPTVCYVDDEAFSAGVYLAISCDRIAMKTGSTIGASTPWVPGAGGLPTELPEDVKKKFYSAAKAIFRATAQEKGYPEALIEGMIDPSVVVQQVEIDGKKMMLTQDEVEKRRKDIARELKGNLTAQQAELDRRVVVVSTVQEGKGPIALTSPEAKTYGLAKEVVSSRDELMKDLGIEHARIEQIEHNWSETVFGWLAGPIVSGLLLTVGLMCLYIEFNHPGLLLPAIAGGICIVLVLFSQYFVGLANYTDILLFIIGAALLAVELFVLPGHGIFGITGLILMVAALFLSRQPFVVPDISNPWDVDLFVQNIVVMGASLVALLGFAIVMARFLPGMPYLNRLVLQSIGPAPAEQMVGSAGMDVHVIEVGAIGESLSLLRPSGRARFGNKILDVVTEGEFIEPGQPIEVIETRGNRIVVRPPKRDDQERQA